jgi:hypothetical protein
MDSMANWLAPLGALITVGLGVFGLLAPLRAAAMVGLAPHERRGLTELRATYGGLFLGMGLACLLWPQPAAYAVASLAWGGAAAARLISMAMDRNPSWLNAGGVLLEGVLGVLLWTGLRGT